MQRQPEILNIPRGNPISIIRAFVIQLAPLLCMLFALIILVLSRGTQNPDLLFDLLFCFLLVLPMARQVRIFIKNFYSETPYVTMDKSGLVCSLPTRWLCPWSLVATCACKKDNGRTVLQVFVRGRVEKVINIDFALAAQPEQSLAKATTACAAWIIATRDARDRYGESR